ncbi:hypothetical protein Patl1_29975 [Pistacia atlantica]|uniref:Uncharacterized protein n=1 Tax=Pistacia atlantica TaxID=434234 RepID=A0ACC1A7G5_9ROSI|nr:hypothetical protein Patl1_29975 [Pistacia atlantica]
MWVLLRDVGAGKSSLCCALLKSNLLNFRYFGGLIIASEPSPFGFKIKFEIWDTTDQERYHSLAPMYYKGASVAIVVYDITNQARVCQ